MGKQLSYYNKASTLYFTYLVLEFGPPVILRGLHNANCGLELSTPSKQFPIQVHVRR